MNARQIIRNALEDMVEITRDDIEEAILALDLTDLIRDAIAENIQGAVQRVVEEEIESAVEEAIEQTFC